MVLVVALAVAAAAVASAGAGGWVWSKLVVVQWNRIRLKVERIEVEVPDLPDALDGVKLAQLSDIHHDPNRSKRMQYINDEFLRHTMETINEEDPALLLLTGDFIVHNKEAIHDLVPFLKMAKMPMWAVLGNHDNYDSNPYCRQVLENEAGVKVLENEHAFPLGPGLALVGLGDPWSDRFHPELTMSSVHIDPKVPRVVMSHQPDTFEKLAEYRCDLVLAGHTHGGQVRLPVVGPVVPFLAKTMRKVLPKNFGSKKRKERRARINRHYEWIYGMHSLPNSTGGTNQLYINRGLGSAAGIRLNCDPELTIITLRKKL